MFEQETPLTKRINELAKKAKTVGLTEAENWYTTKTENNTTPFS